MSNAPSKDSPPPVLPPGRKPWRRFVVLVILCLGLGGVDAYVWLEFTARPLPPGGDLEAPAELSFDGSSEGCNETVFLATLERPIPDGKSALWCATAPMAWQELDAAEMKPVDIQGAEDICRELRATPDSKIEREHFYVAAGRSENGIVERIGRELSQRFPHALPPPAPGTPAEFMLAYAYLEVAIHYDFFFKHSEEPLQFKDASGKTTPVHAFGIRKEDFGPTREQVLVLFRNNGEFALDLSHGTKPYQIVLARMARKATLQDTLADLDKRIAAASPYHLNHSAMMFAPSMNWKVTHRYKELEGPVVNDPHQRRVELAYQSIQFKMDRKGAYVASAMTVVLPDNGHPEEPPNPDHYFFDRPYLIVMKRRGVRQPFFVMWVENAELMQRR